MKAEHAEVYWQGLVAGLIGYATVAVVMAAGNVLVGRSPFHTAALLGAAVFYGLRDPAQLVIWPGAVLAYNGIHLLFFLALGTVAAWLARFAERGPHFWYIGVVLMLFVMFHMFGVFLLVTQPIREALSPWALVAAGFAALLTMSVYLVAVHPALRAELRDFSARDVDATDA